MLKVLPTYQHDMLFVLPFTMYREADMKVLQQYPNQIYQYRVYMAIGYRAAGTGGGAAAPSQKCQVG